MRLPALRALVPGDGAGRARVLAQRVGLTEPRRQDGVELPGWWVAHDPDEIVATPGGHANFGMAHGAAGCSPCSPSPRSVAARSTAKERRSPS